MMMVFVAAPPPLSFCLCLSACGLVVDGQMGKFNNERGRIGEIETPGQQKGTTKYVSQNIFIGLLFNLTNIIFVLVYTMLL